MKTHIECPTCRCADRTVGPDLALDRREEVFRLVWDRMTEQGAPCRGPVPLFSSDQARYAVGSQRDSISCLVPDALAQEWDRSRCHKYADEIPGMREAIPGLPGEDYIRDGFLQQLQEAAEEAPKGADWTTVFHTRMRLIASQYNISAPHHEQTS